jgi:hypothetical protein
VGFTERLEIVARLPNLLCHEYTTDGLLVSRRNRLFLIPDLAVPRLQPLGRVPWGPVQWPAYIGLLDGALKAGIQQALQVDPRRYLLAARKRWWVMTDGGEVHDLGALPVGRPMARGLCVSRGSVYIAEYRSNSARDSVQILRSTDLEQFEVAWRFPARTVRHVHALIPDPHLTDRIWILTGDFDHESSIWHTDDQFESVDHYLNLGQRSRATDLICHPERLVWGMDSPLETPYIMESPRFDGVGAQTAKPVHRLDGPVYYTTQNEAGGCYMGTTVEPGPAVLDSLARIHAWAPGDKWQEVARWQHAPVPRYGIVHMPRGVLPGSFVVCSTRALSPGDGRLTIARDRALDG